MYVLTYQSIMKLFDVFAFPTQCLLRVITSCFKEWVLYKPVTSRPCNSERYLICRGFRKCDRDVVTFLSEMELYADNHQYPDLSGGVLAWSPEEQAYLQSHMKGFMKTQCDMIQSTFAFDKTDLTKYDWSVQIRNAQHWCSAFRIPGNLQQNAGLYKPYGYKPT